MEMIGQLNSMIWIGELILLRNIISVSYSESRLSHYIQFENMMMEII